MVKTGNECLLGNYMSSRGKTCHGSLLRGRRDIQRVGYGMGWERSTMLITGRDTAQTERMLM